MGGIDADKTLAIYDDIGTRVLRLFVLPETDEVVFTRRRKCDTRHGDECMTLLVVGALQRDRDGADFAAVGVVVDACGLCGKFVRVQQSGEQVGIGGIADERGNYTSVDTQCVCVMYLHSTTLAQPYGSCQVVLFRCTLPDVLRAFGLRIEGVLDEHVTVERQRSGERHEARGVFAGDVMEGIYHGGT
jgi:hypothetical protein